ncbi:MAG: PHP domain-containing protein [Clostridia bacterium]|nr:PHP domain-containing protein [Clostridia bacterium]
MREIKKLDLHMHSKISDGTDTPEEILSYIVEKGMDLFSVTDHDDFRAYQHILPLLDRSTPRFLTGIELSCRDQGGKYHILGYGFDPEHSAIRNLVAKSHGFRMEKAYARIDFLKDKFGFVFPQEEIDELLKNDNPGKPHFGNLMVKYGYAPSKEEAISQYLNQLVVKDKNLVPKEAIEGILESGGIPVLAHPSYGSGEELYFGEEMEERVRYLIGFGLQGLEAFYSAFTPRLQNEILSYAEKYRLYVTAGSDYHGKNKLVVLGDTNLAGQETWPDGLVRFVDKVGDKLY